MIRAAQLQHDDTADHIRNSAAAIAFTGAFGLVHAAVFTWVLPGQQFFIEIPTLIGLSVALLAIAERMRRSAK